MVVLLAEDEVPIPPKARSAGVAQAIVRGGFAERRSINTY